MAFVAEFQWESWIFTYSKLFFHVLKGSHFENSEAKLQYVQEKYFQF